MRILVLIILQAVSLVSFARVELRTLSVVEVSLRDRVTLADIVEWDGQDQELEKSLEAIVLKNIGGDEGGHLTFKRDQILSIYRMSLSKDSLLSQKNPLLKLADKTIVTFSNEVISKEEMRRNLLRVLKARCSECDYKIEFSRVPQPKTPSWSINYESINDRGPFLLTVKDADQDLYISGKISAFKKVFVTKKVVPIGMSIQVEDLEERILDITMMREDPLDQKEILGKKFSLLVARGQPIYSSQLQREFDVQKGLPIKAIIEDEHMQISVQLRAEENGFKGDVVKVKNMETQKVGLGQVIEKGVVKIQ